MAIQNWSEDIILVDLPAEPEMGDELKTITEIVRDRGDCDIVVDFSSVDIVTSSSLSKLLKLRKLLGDCGHRLVLGRQELNRWLFHQAATLGEYHALYLRCAWVWVSSKTYLIKGSSC